MTQINPVCPNCNCPQCCNPTSKKTNYSGVTIDINNPTVNVPPEYTVYDNVISEGKYNTAFASPVYTKQVYDIPETKIYPEITSTEKAE